MNRIIEGVRWLNTTEPSLLFSMFCVRQRVIDTQLDGAEFEEMSRCFIADLQTSLYSVKTMLTILPEENLGAILREREVDSRGQSS